MIDLLKGKQRKLTLANEEQYNSYYVLTDLSNVIASHNEENFSSSIGYPTNELGENINDRNYKEDIAAQNSVIKIAENIRPENLISLTSTPSGTPIIDKNGIVVSGNNRTMSLKLALKKYPENYKKYKEQLIEDIDSFGIEPEMVERYEHPILVRLVEDLPKRLTTEDLAKFNQDSKKGERPVDRAIKLSNILLENTRCKNVILSIIDGYDTFSDLYSPIAKNDRKKLVENLVSCSLITENQLPNYYDNGEFTDAGKDFVEMLLSSIILTPNALRVSNVEGVKRLRQIIIGSLPLLVTNENLGIGSLKKYISEAIIIQYKIIQVGDFSDYIRSQTLFDEEKFDTKSLYINALLRQGRNDFKNSIRKYNDSVKANEGESLFLSEKLDVNEIFKLTIENSVEEKERKLIQSIYPTNTKDIKKMENISELQTEELISQPIKIIEENNIKFLFGDNWYKSHPDKVLGIAYETSGAFGKVTKYSGGIEVLSRIQVDESFIGANKALIDPLASDSSDMNISAEILKPEINEFVKDVVEKSFVEIEKKKKNSKLKIEEDAAFTPIKELNTFKQTFENINPKITKEEIEVFTWYKSSIGKPLSRNYTSLFKDDFFTEEEAKNMRETHVYEVSKEVINRWVKDGLLVYYKNELIPAFEYKSGNMYDKKIKLEDEKEEIIRLYGEDVYEKQKLILNEGFIQVYNKRLIIGGENSLVISVNSTIAKEFKISTIEDYPPEKKWKIKSFGTKDNYGKPDIIKDLETYSDYKKEEFEEISLQDAFGWWLLNKKPELTQPITHLEIYKYYVLGKSPHIAGTDDSEAQKKLAEAKKSKLIASTKKDGERLFAQFLATQLVPNDKIRLETQWNISFNNYLPIDLNKVPVAFTMAKYVYGNEETVRPEKRDAVAFTMNNGTGILSYDVGVGKTPSAIFTISAFMDAGYCKRPCIVVPNQVYKQFIADFKEFAPHIPILEAYNLGKEYIENFKNSQGKIDKVQEGTVTMMTYEGLENIGFNEETTNNLTTTLYEILNQGGESEKETKKASFLSRIEELVGKGLKGGIIPIEDLGFDFMCYDEAHAMKKIFTSVKGEIEENEKGGKSRGKNQYQISSGSPSSRALKGFMLNYYILQKNNYKNILLLTATPFTNSPLEIFSMLSMVSYEKLKEGELANLKSFFDNYVQTSTELVINSKLKPEYKQVILGFNNLISLQSLIRRYILYKTGEDVGVIRPKKYVLPYLKEIENGIVIDIPEDRKVETYIPMTPQQKQMMDDIILYVEGTAKLTKNIYDSDIEELREENNDEDDDNSDKTIGVEVDEDDLNEDEKRGVRTIKGLSYSRNLALSPYLYEYSGLGKPDYKNYIEKSPKLYYVMKCVKSVRDYNISHGEKVAGQVIYMDRGIEYFKLIKEYLVKECGFAEHEIGIIQSGLPKSGVRSKEYVKNLFNGEIYNEKTKLFETVDDYNRIKVVIGSSTIKEGMNLQKYGAVLYNCFIDWNPTDIQQLEGRIYRQKNTYENVRIVNPLVVDSADIFLFQKLQEKTSRLNTIWSTDGHSNVLNTQEFNPAELKYALIKNPEIIAELKILEEEERLKSEILGFNRQLENVEQIERASNFIINYFEKLKSEIEKYREIEYTGDLLIDSTKLVAAVKDIEKNQTDNEGKEIIASWQKDSLLKELSKLKQDSRYFGDSDGEYAKEIKKLVDRLNNVSSITSIFYKPYYFSDFSVSVRDMNKFMNSFVKQYDIDFDIKYYKESLEKFKKQANESKLLIENKIKEISSKENKELLIQEAIEEKERQKIIYKNIPELVVDFSKLNFLLSNKKVIEGRKKVYTSCPPMEEDGVTFATDEEALKHLELCLAKEQQTKIYNWSEESGYTPQRIELHDKIINDLFSEVKCIKSDVKPIAIFTGGSPASGKSFFLTKNAEYLLSKNIFHLDADEIRSKLPEYKGWNANSTHLETQDIVNNLLDRIGSEKCRYNFIYDGTMNKAKKYFTLIKKAKDLGYKTYIIFMEIPYAEAKKRVIERYKRTGRFVPMEVIDDFFTKIGDKSKGQAALDELKPYVDGYIVVDGLTGNIIDTGGEGLPKDIKPKVYTNNLLEVSKEEDKLDVEKMIKSLKIALKFSSTEDKKVIEKRIKALILTLKYK